MSKKVWILNHYAGNMFTVGGGRHYCIAKYLKENGYDPVVFCSNYDHFTRKNTFEEVTSYVTKTEPVTGVPYVFLKTREYPNNGIKRVFNMWDFYHGMRKLAKKFAAENGAPDVIYASSVHPLTLVAGIKIAKKFGVKCISEVRDLWPESIVAYSTKWTRKSLVMKVLYAGEKWIYKKSDRVIMTMAGGYDYIKDQGWDNVIPESKIVHISNGVDLEPFDENISEHHFDDPDLSDKMHKNFIYTGSVRKVNDLSMLISAARKLKEAGNDTARILVFGDGDELENMKNEAKDLDNIVFKGRVPKQNVPSILSQGYASILHNKSTELDKYGHCQNKFFEYLAAGKPILLTYPEGHSVVKQYGCGIEAPRQEPQAIADAISAFCELSETDYEKYCRNTYDCARLFDYGELTRQLINVINA